MQHIPAEEQVADGFTKALSKAVFQHFRDKLMVFSQSTISLRGMLGKLIQTVN